MGTRYTKSIPKSVYFCKEGAWWAGPFVHPQKGRTNEEYKLIPAKETAENMSSFSPELTRKINELLEQGEKLKKMVETPRPSVSQEELDKLAAWLDSDEGKRVMKEAINKANEVCDTLERAFDVDPKLLREPFNI